jgi:hypothetical protein
MNCKKSILAENLHKFTFFSEAPIALRFSESNQSYILCMRVYPLAFIPFYRYGREDEEVMGLKFCNEAIIALQQIWPKVETEQRFDLSPLQVIWKFYFESFSEIRPTAPTLLTITNSF